MLNNFTSSQKNIRFSKGESILGKTIISEPYKHITARGNSYMKGVVRCDLCGHEKLIPLTGITIKCGPCKTLSRKIIDRGNYVELELKGGEFIKLDKEDYDRVKIHSWYLTKRRSVETRMGKLVKIHRFLINCPDDMDVDHINSDYLDNRKLNLRICLHKDNCRNTLKRKNSEGKFKGVHYSKAKNSYVACLWVNGKLYSKMVKSDIDGAKWYDEMSVKHFGEFAKTNHMLGLI